MEMVLQDERIVIGKFQAGEEPDLDEESTYEDFLETYDCRMSVYQATIDKVFLHVARKELVQKPHFII